MSLAFISSPSANYDSRGDHAIRLIILHYTGMKSLDAALARLRDTHAKKKVSAHYLIERDGKIHQLVDDKHRAWHAGIGYWQGERALNAVSIGIELVNRGHEWGYQPFPAAQITACIELVQMLQQRHNIPAHRVVGHSDVAPLRKTDPGEYFPWERLAQQGIGLWPLPAIALDHTLSALTVDAARQALRDIGYECAVTGHYDPDLRQIILAFQRHWLPHALSGLLDERTAACLLTVRAAMMKAMGGVLSLT